MISIVCQGKAFEVELYPIPLRDKKDDNDMDLVGK